MAIELPLRPITVDEYHRMAEAGIIEHDERVELLDGMLVAMPPISGPHVFTHARLVKYLILTLGDHADVAGQASLPMPPGNEPQPDITVFAVRDGMLVEKSWTSEEIFAAIEIADSTLRSDLVSKQRTYARARIQEYLIVDVQHHCLFRHTQPRGDGYVSIELLRPGEVFSLVALPDIPLEVDRFIPFRGVPVE